MAIFRYDSVLMSSANKTTRSAGAGRYGALAIPLRRYKSGFYQKSGLKGKIEFLGPTIVTERALYLNGEDEIASCARRATGSSPQSLEYKASDLGE